jgi:hypothetical protein
LKHNSERDYYESLLNRGAASTSKQGAIENIGNLLALVCVAKTTAGSALFAEHKVGAMGKESVFPLITLLVSIAWFHQNQPKEEVENAKENLKNCMRDIEIFYPRTVGNEWDPPKKHSYLQLSTYMTFHGNTLNFYSGFGERSHIEYVKDNALRTQRQIQSFIEQMAHRVEENAIPSVAEHIPEEISGI